MKFTSFKNLFIIVLSLFLLLQTGCQKKYHTDPVLQERIESYQEQVKEKDAQIVEIKEQYKKQNEEDRRVEAARHETEVQGYKDEIENLKKDKNDLAKYKMMYEDSKRLEKIEDETYSDIKEIERIKRARERAVLSIVVVTLLIIIITLAVMYIRQSYVIRRDASLLVKKASRERLGGFDE